MANWKKLTFGQTITDGKPGEKIKECVEELQKKAITCIVSSVPGFAFVQSGDNTLEFRPDGEENNPDGNGLKKDLVKAGNATMGSSGELKVRKSKGQYIIDIVFPKGPEVTSGGGGEDGDAGQDGESPYITVDEIENGTRVTIHNPDGSTEYFDVTNGRNGTNGRDGLITSLSDESESITALDPNGGHTLKIEDGALKLVLNVARYKLDITRGALSLVQDGATAELEIQGPDLATCTNFLESGGDS